MKRSETRVLRKMQPVAPATGTSSASDQVKGPCHNCPVTNHCPLYPHVARISGAPLRRRLLHKGEYLFHSGSTMRAIYMVCSGSVMTRLITSQGGVMVPAFFVPGKVVGIEAVGEGRFSCDAVALENSMVCEAPYTWLSGLAETNPALQHSLLRLLSEEIEHLEARLIRLGCYDAEERIASWLLDFEAMHRQFTGNTDELPLPMTRQDIGDHVGVALETVSRVFTDLRRKQIIEVRDHGVRVLDRTRLRNVAHASSAEHRPE
jgi:CRP/FNR family transcriptional regulator